MTQAQKFLFFLFVFIILSGFANAQNGQPFIRNYDPSEYKGSTQIWSIIQDSRGVMYFGGNDGLYQYDGVQWRQIIIGPGAAIRSMDIDSNGRVYMGSTGDFGYLEPNANGKLQFISIAKKYLDSTNLDFSDIWTTYYHNNKVYFCSNTHLFIYDKTSENPLSVKKGDYFLMYKGRDKLMVFTQPDGIKEIVDTTLQEIPGGNTFWTMFMLPFEKDKYLIGNSGTGIQIYNPIATGKEPYVSSHYFKSQKINETNKFLIENQIYGGLQISDNLYAIATIRSGLVLINKRGEIVQIINKSKGLQSNTVHTLYADRQQQVWAGLTYGISRLELNSPITIFNASNNLEGSIYNVVRHNKDIYASTNLGLFKLINEKFNGIPQLSGENAIQVFEIKSFRIDGERKLLAGATSGIWEIEGLKAKNLALNTPFFIHQSNADPHKFYGIDNGYLITFGYKQNKWTSVDTLLFSGYNSFIGLVDKDNKVWLTADGKPGFVDLNLDKTKINFEIGKIPDDIEINGIVLHDESLLFLSNKGLFEYNDKLPGLVEGSSPIAAALKGKSIIQLDKVNANTYWALFNTEPEITIESIQIVNDKIHQDSISFKRLESFEGFIADGDSIMWIISPKSLFQYEMSKTFVSENRLSLIRKFQAGRDSVFFHGSFYNEIANEKVLIPKQTAEFIPTLEYKFNNVVFEYALPFYDNEKANQYRYKLEGSSLDEWSEWNSNTRKEYTNLPSGRYAFNVLAKNIYGLPTSVSKYEFIVLPPWYMAWYMFLIYTAFGVLLLWGIIKLYTKRLEADKKRLELIVTERTAEIMQQKEEILTQAEYLKDANRQINSKNEELLYKNQQVTDSIQSASRIQNAMLPEKEYLDRLLPDHFVFFQPRDIVSGDFYWVRELNDLILIAVADCTGHGVPGAFVSMLGVSLLNDVVRKKDVNTAAKVLEEMRIEIKNNLKQKGKISDIREGMDMAFLAFNPKTGVVNYAGAYNPLYLIRNNELIEYKATRNPIGIHRFEKPFKDEYFTIQNGDRLYLFSDGYIDQIGGAKSKKYKSARFKELLLKTVSENMKHQGHEIEKEINGWIGENEQIDDILVMGVTF